MSEGRRDLQVENGEKLARFGETDDGVSGEDAIAVQGLQ